MRLVRYDAGGGPRLGELRGGEVYDLGPGDMKDLLLAPRRGEAPVVGARLLCPLERPGKILAQKANYAPPGTPPVPPLSTPWLFNKLTDAVQGPEAPIVLWPMAAGVIEEIEVAIIIGRPGRNIPPSEALDHVAGYTICNDVSALRLDVPPAGRRDESFDRFIDSINGKWLEGYTVLGPCIVTPDEMPPVDGLDFVTRVNGRERFRGNTRDALHRQAEIIAYASRFCTLRTGDVIATGMMAGGPIVYLQPGDVVEGEVDGIGVLRNPVVAEAQ